MGCISCLELHTSCLFPWTCLRLLVPMSPLCPEGVPEAPGCVVGKQVLFVQRLE